MKTTLALAALFIFVLVGGYKWHPSTQRTITPSYTVPDASGVVTSNTSLAPAASTTGTNIEPSLAIIPSGYTFAQVSSHSTRTNCWTSINGNVYDLTKWIGTHPGGESAIIQLCGTDGSSAFENQHGNNNSANKVLATFIIGSLLK